MLWVPSALGAAMALAAVAFGEPALAAGFVALVVAGALLNLALSRIATNGRGFSTGETLATAALAWALTGLLGAIPFWLNAQLVVDDGALAVFRDPLSSLFESVSGFTTTGLTMVSDASELPRTMQLWRSSMQWVGGVGLALLMISLMNPERDGGDLPETELALPDGENLARTVRIVWAIYAGLTAIGIGAFLASGAPAWESVNHAMTGIATGGFTVTENSFADYAAPVQIVAMGLTVAGAISFGVYREALTAGEPLAPLRSGPVRVLLGGIAFAIALLWLARLEFETDAGPLVVPFQVISAFGTAGFSTATLGDWHSAPLAVLIACMTIGGASGATTGGIKTDRLLLLWRGIGWRVRRLFADGRGSAHVVDGERRPSDRARLEVEGAATLTALWIVTALGGCLALAPVVGDEHSFTEIAFEVMSAQSGVGLSVGIAGESLPAAGKWTLIVLMWAGRLELLAACALLWLPFARRADPDPARS